MTPLTIELPLTVEAIQSYLPHRYPFLLVDRIVDIGEDFIVGEKCVTINEWYFQGHFPGNPVMPGVLMIEAMAQTGAVLELSREESRNKYAILVGVDEARFRRIVAPGDVLRIEMKQMFRRRNLGRTAGKITVNGEIACEAIITFTVHEGVPQKANGSRQ